MKLSTLIVMLLCLTGCRSAKINIDPSISAVEASDFTLAMSACEAGIGRGVDICRVKEGAPIDAVWRLVVPVGKNSFISGELTVYYKDQSKSYPLNSQVIEIPWKDLLGEATWNRDHDGEAIALAQIRWKTPEGIEEIWRARGIAKLVVTKVGYDPLPLDSGFVAFGSTCKIQYATSGRSAVLCK